MALALYEIRADQTGTVYGLPKTGPHLARPLRGGPASLRAELATLYRRQTGKVPTASALADAIASLEGEAADTDRVHLHLRVAEHGGAQWLDLGDPTGRAVRIDGDSWEVVAAAPVWFRRTELTGALPDPERGGSLDELWELVNIDPDDRVLVLAILLAQLFPNIAHPIAFLLAEQGSGKSTGVAILGGLLDPSPVPLRKPPKDEEGWITAAAGSHVVAIDNISRIPEWLSDSLCRAATGDGDVRRRLYTDADLQVFAFRKCVWLTAVDLSGIRDDLADRTVILNLHRITERRTDAELQAAWQSAHPRLLGAVLNLAARVLAELPGAPTTDLPRMADFYRILRALDAVLGTGGAARYRNAVQHLAEEMAEGDPLAVALREMVTAPVREVTSSQLLTALGLYWQRQMTAPPRSWPGTPRALSAQLTRIKPTLERLGWQITKHERGGATTQLRWSITPPQE
jgi:hypothetical protein